MQTIYYKAFQELKMTNKLTSDEIVEHVRKERYEHKRLKSLTGA